MLGVTTFIVRMNGMTESLRNTCSASEPIFHNSLLSEYLQSQVMLVVIRAPAFLLFCCNRLSKLGEKDAIKDSPKTSSFVLSATLYLYCLLKIEIVSMVLGSLPVSESASTLITLDARNTDLVDLVVAALLLLLSLLTTARFRFGPAIVDVAVE